MEKEEWYDNWQSRGEEKKKKKKKKSEKCKKLEKSLRDIMLFNGAETERQVNYKPV